MDKQKYIQATAYGQDAYLKEVQDVKRELF